MLWIGETFEELSRLAGNALFVDGKPAPLVALEEVNGFMDDMLQEPKPRKGEVG